MKFILLKEVILDRFSRNYWLNFLIIHSLRIFENISYNTLYGLEKANISR
jgi:hypothetical protein